MTDNEYKKLGETYLKEKELERSIMKIEDEIAHIDATILDLNTYDIKEISLRYSWNERHDKAFWSKNDVNEKVEWSAFNYPKLLSKALESYKQELVFILNDLKLKLKDVIELKELLIDKGE